MAVQLLVNYVCQCSADFRYWDPDILYGDHALRISFIHFV